MICKRACLNPRRVYVQNCTQLMVDRCFQGASGSGRELCALLAPIGASMAAPLQGQARKNPTPPSLRECVVPQPDQVKPSETEASQVKASRYRQVEDLYHAALDRGPEYLDSACAGDPALRAEVEALLASFRSWSASVPPVGTPVLPRFGAYQCDGILGSGGHGHGISRAPRRWPVPS
jgi:hypothetical protein